VTGGTTLKYQNSEYDFGKPFARLSVFDSVLQYNPGITAEQLSTLDGATKIAESLGLKVKPGTPLGKLQTEIFEETVEHKLDQPTFITEYPTEVSPLARRSDTNPAVTDRFEFFIGGRELANGFSELNDAEDQAERFLEQVKAKDAGDDEAMYYDADFVRALEYGLPPTAGEGIGIDRLIMLFANAPSIRDVLLFPHMRPE
jgi:lysyl-tRNA synthetase class 2